MDLAKELARQAKKKGICKPWYNELKSLNGDNINAMAQMYLKGIDFCLANDYPDNGFIRTHFKGKMEQYGVFLDDDIKIENKPKCVCLGATCGRVEITGFNVCEIYAKHNVKLNVIAKDNAFVVIDVFDDAVVNVCASDRAKVCVNHYVGNGQVIKCAMDDATIKVIEKHKKTY
jgi:hypothetical protein